MTLTPEQRTTNPMTTIPMKASCAAIITALNGTLEQLRADENAKVAVPIDFAETPAKIRAAIYGEILNMIEGHAVKPTSTDVVTDKAQTIRVGDAPELPLAPVDGASDHAGVNSPS